MSCVKNLKPFAEYATKHIPKGYELEVGKRNVTLWRETQTGKRYEINMGFVDGEFNYSRFSFNPYTDSPFGKDSNDPICFGNDATKAMNKWKSVLGTK